jgi:hypothetical protein
VSGWHLTRLLCGYRCSRDFPPGLESSHHLPAVGMGRKEVASGTKMHSHRAILRKEALGAPSASSLPMIRSPNTFDRAGIVCLLPSTGKK